MNRPELSKDCNVLAFYGLRPGAEALLGFFETFNAWSTELGFQPDWMLTEGGGKKRQGELDIVSKRLKASKFDGFTSLEISCRIPDAFYPADDCWTGAFISLKINTACVSVRTSVLTFEDRLLAQGKALVALLRPAYGIGFSRERKLGPIFFAVGIDQGLSMNEADDLEGLDIAFWGRGMRLPVWERGLLRDVYPWNFLTGSHLTKPVHGVALKEWIQQNPERGSLEPIDDEVMLWRVPEVSTKSLSRELRKAGAIFDWTVHIEGADLHPQAMVSRARFLD